MIDTDRYEGHTEGPWVALHKYWGKKGSHGGGLRKEGAEDAGKYVQSHVYTEAYLNTKDTYDSDTPTLDWGSIVNGVCIDNMATANLVADAPLLLAELKRMYEFRDRVLAAFVEMPHNKRSLTYLLNWLGYCNYYSHDDYLKGLHPHSLGLFELKDEWMEKAQQYLESEEE